MKPHMRDLIAWWCFLRYSAKYGNPGRKYSRTRGKWISMVLNWASILLREGDPSEAKRSIFDDYWTGKRSGEPGDAYRKDAYKVMKLASTRLAREGITDTPGVIDVATEFMDNMEALRWLVSSGTFADVVEYADEWFPLPRKCGGESGE